MLVIEKIGDAENQRNTQKSPPNFVDVLGFIEPLCLFAVVPGFGHVFASHPAAFATGSRSLIMRSAKKNNAIQPAELIAIAKRQKAGASLIPACE